MAIKGKPRGSTLVKKIIDREDFSDKSDNFEEIVKMQRTNNYYYPLPNGSKINCANAEEYEELQKIAKPYLDAAEDIPADSWNDVKHYLTNCLNYFVINNTLTDIRRASEKIKDPEEKRSYEEAQISINSELMKQSNTLQRTIIDQRQKLDSLRDAKKVQNASLAEAIETYKEDAVEHCNNHKGEYQWMTTCPAPKCIHNQRPFIVLQQAPHFAWDFAANPSIVWNQQIFELTKKYYTDEEEYDEIDSSYDSEGLSFKDAARILRLAPIGWLAAVWEKQMDGDLSFPIDLDKVINDKIALAELLEEEEVVINTKQELK